METVLVIAVGLGLIIGGIIFYQQAQVTSSAAQIMRNGVTLSTEVRRRFPGGEGMTPDITAAVRAVSSLAPSVFSNLTIHTASGTQRQFTLVFQTGNQKVCRKAVPSQALADSEDYRFEEYGHDVLTVICIAGTQVYMVYYF